MKAILIPLILLACISTTHSQDWSQLPELPVWYELENTSFGKNMYYFPNFDTARGGLSALIPYFTLNTPTIYNRFKGDTENMFNWGFRAAHATGDFNGDSIPDYYFHSRVAFYPGKQYGVPPDTPYVKNYDEEIRGDNKKYFILDIDNDGKQDVIVGHQYEPSPQIPAQFLSSIIFGNTDLTKMQVVGMPHTPDINALQECLVDVYMNNGQPRMITMTWDKNRKNSTLHIWGITLITAGTQMKVEYKKMSSILLDKDTDGQYLPNPLIIHEGVLSHTLKYNNSTYSIDNNKFTLLYTNIGLVATINRINSIKNPKQQGWINRWQDENGVYWGMFYNGSPQNNSLPVAKVKLTFVDTNKNITNFLENLISIGDINNDGLGDFAVKYTPTGIGTHKFAILLGTVGTVDVDDASSTKTTNPLISIKARNTILSKHDNLNVNVVVEYQGTYSIDIYSMDGKKVTTLWSGELQKGETDITLQPSLQPLATGRYNLMIDNGTQFHVCAILIQ